MSAYHRNYGYEEDPDDPDDSRSWNRTRGHWTTQAYPDSPGTWNNPNAPSTRNNPYSAGSRPNLDYARSHTDGPGTGHNSYTAESNYPGTFEEPDYPGSQRDPYHHGSADYQSRPNYASSRTNLGYLGSLEKPDYPGAQGNSSNYPGSRKNPGYAASNRQPSLSSLGEPDYQTKNQPKSQDFWGEPDYPGAEEYRKAPVLWDEPDYPGADGYDFGPSETQNLPRRTSSIQPSFRHGGASSLGFLSRDNEDNPESIELRSKKMMTPHDYSGTRDHGTGYVNQAYDDEVNLDRAYGNPPLNGYDWDKSPQVQKLIATLAPMTLRERNKAIRSQPRTMEEKRILRKMVDKEKNKQPRRFLEFGCCMQCLNSISQAFRRSKNSLSEVLGAVSLWQKTLKVIGGKFGTSVLSYFNFLQWLWKFNVFFFILIFGFLIIPQLTVAEKNNLPFTGLEFFTGSGYFNDTVL